MLIFWTLRLSFRSDVAFGAVFGSFFPGAAAFSDLFRPGKVYDMNKSHGAYIHDARTGKYYLDFFSFFASWPVSHNHPKMKDPEFLQQIGHIACFNPSNSDIYTVEMAQFVATFERVAMPPEFKHLFLVSGGSLAVENALKAAMDWKVRKSTRARFLPPRLCFLCISYFVLRYCCWTWRARTKNNSFQGGLPWPLRLLLVADQH